MRPPHDAATSATEPTAPDAPPPGRRSRPGLPRTIWTLLFTDLVKLLVITATALVVAISFAAAIKPLADGDVGPGAVVLLMGLLAVPMLQFALPFAAGFAATLGYHRFAADRELLAASAGGVSYRAVFAPALLLALLLAAAVALLSNTAIPVFLRSAERLVTQDVARLVTAPLERGQTLVINDWQITADRVTALGPQDGTPFFERIVLEDALVARFTDEPTGATTADGAADQAAPDRPNHVPEPAYLTAQRIDLVMANAESAEGGSAVDIYLAVTQAAGEGFEGLYQIDRLTYRFPEPLRIPNAFDNDPKFLSIDEMLAVRAQPRRFESVDEWVRRLAMTMARQRHIQAVQARIDSGVPVRFTRGDEVFAVEATAVRPGDDVIELGRRPDAVGFSASQPTVIVEHTRDDGSLVRYEATRGALVFDDAVSLADVLGFAQQGRQQTAPQLFVELALDDVTTRTVPASGQPAQQARVTLGGLALPDAADVRETELPLDEILERADAMATPGSPLADELRDGARKVRDEADELRREIDSKIHERAAYTLASGLMVLTGAVMALRLRDAMPLPVYLWSFFPALLAVLTISSGQGLIYKANPLGFLVLWGGVAALAAFTFGQYRILVRH